eukprot:52908-Chlamydomonas_euryale.AAC.1
MCHACARARVWLWGVCGGRVGGLGLAQLQLSHAHCACAWKPGASFLGLHDAHTRARVLSHASLSNEPGVHASLCMSRVCMRHCA